MTEGKLKKEYKKQNQTLGLSNNKEASLHMDILVYKRKCFE